MKKMIHRQSIKICVYLKPHTILTDSADFTRILLYTVSQYLIAVKEEGSNVENLVVVYDLEFAMKVHFYCLRIKFKIENSRPGFIDRLIDRL